MITDIDITAIEPFAGGVSFGTAGPYERVIGIAHGAVDPKDGANAAIVNLDKAPRNAKGLVEYRTDLFILRPAKPNGTLLYEVNNRSLKLLMMAIMGAQPQGFPPALNDPKTLEDAGDALLLKRGWTLVWSGWDPNASRLNHGLAMDAPIAFDRGKPVEQDIRDEFLGGGFFPPSENFPLSYETASLDPKLARLTWRRREADPPQSVSPERWHFIDSRTAALNEGAPAPGVLYELRYRARAPHVMGLGFAATRDLISYLRAGKGPAPSIKHAIAMGSSQSGRYLRGFIAEGFNRDETGKKVFDGVLSFIAGAGKVFLNAPFAQPARTNTKFTDHLYPDFSFPFSAARTKHPVSGHFGAILQEDGSDPLIMDVNTSTEYWQKAASLVTSDPSGRADLTLPENARAYFLTGLAHAPFPLGSMFAHPVNLVSPGPVLRALLTDLNDWVETGRAPPESRVPQIADAGLVPPSQLAFPKGPGLSVPSGANSAIERRDWVHPHPDQDLRYPVLVPQVDADGNERAGIRLPEIAVPLGSYAGWNLYKPPFPEGELAGLFGSFIPFAKTKAQRLAVGDPRLSLEERYAGKSDYVRRIEAAAKALVVQRLLLDEDVAHIVDAAKATKAFD